MWQPRRQSIANPPMEDSYGRLHMNIDVREIKQVVNILHIYRNGHGACSQVLVYRERKQGKAFTQEVGFPD